ncbi:MAG: peptidylprolyl isomerase [Gammaproteobacteria bacterium]|nr:peptidylprolyl isomerase [Gammaproteobacteria bacterium]
MSDLIATQKDGQRGRQIDANCRVTLHFAVLLETGEEVDTTRRARPATFEMGDGSVLPGFENALLGMQAGDDAQIVIEALDAFGEHNKDNVRLLGVNKFVGIELEPGLMVSFAAPDGELPGVVQRVFADTVEVDFNHPLAGRRIVFDVSVLKVEDSSSA